MSVNRKVTVPLGSSGTCQALHRPHAAASVGGSRRGNPYATSLRPQPEAELRPPRPRDAHVRARRRFRPRAGDRELVRRVFGRRAHFVSLRTVKVGIVVPYSWSFWGAVI